MHPIKNFTTWLFQYGLHHGKDPVPSFAFRCQKMRDWPVDADSWEALSVWMDALQAGGDFRWCMNLAWLDYVEWMKLNNLRPKS